MAFLIPKRRYEAENANFGFLVPFVLCWEYFGTKILKVVKYLVTKKCNPRVLFKYCTVCRLMPDIRNEVENGSFGFQVPSVLFLRVFFGTTILNVDKYLVPKNVTCVLNKYCFSALYQIEINANFGFYGSSVLFFWLFCY